MKRETAFVAAVAVAIALPACEYFEKGPTNPAPSPSPGTAALSISVAPDPLKVLWVCPVGDTYCYGSLDSTVTVTETAGVGGRVDDVDFIVRDSVLGLELTKIHLSSAEVQAKAGTNRIEAMGKLAVRPIIEGYPLKKDIPRPSLNIDITVQVTDDKNNVVKSTKRVPVA